MKFSVAVLTVAVAAAMFSPASALPAAAAPPPGPMLQHQLRPITPGMFERRGDQAFLPPVALPAPNPTASPATPAIAVLVQSVPPAAVGALVGAAFCAAGALDAAA